MNGRKVTCVSVLIGVLVSAEVLGDIISFDPFPIGTGAYTNSAYILEQGPTNTPVIGFSVKWNGSTWLATSSSTKIDAPCAVESGGTLRFSGHNDTSKRTLTRVYSELPCSSGDTNYWSAIVWLDGRDGDDNAYVTWRETDIATYMAIDLGIMNGRLVCRLRESHTLDLGVYTPGKAYHIVARGIVSRGDPRDASYEDTTVWVNPTQGDLLHDNNVAAHYNQISYVSPGYDHDRLEVTSQYIGGRVAYFDELLHCTDVDDINLSIQKIQSATFDPMPRPDDSGTYNHVITHDFDLTSITLGHGRYTDLEGPTNALVEAGYISWPQLGEAIAVTNESLVGLHVTFAGNISTAAVTFASTVTNGFSGGFFLLEVNGDDANIEIRPLDANGNRIGNWSLPINSSSQWSANLTGEGDVARPVRFFGVSDGKLCGLAFTLDDFTGGSGVLTDVKGLQLIDTSPTFDPMIVGIYNGPTEELTSGSTAAPMTAATFNRPLTDNPITNDFEISGISTADRDWNTVIGTATGNIHVPSDSILVYPLNGSAPANQEAAMEGLAVNGTLNTGHYMEYMFASPVEDATDRIFMIDDVTFDKNAVVVRPLDADRFPISTHSLTIGAADWGDALTPNSITYNNWGGTQSGRQIGGTTFGINDFAGGTGSVNSVWGIRIEDVSGYIDLMLVGRTKASGTLIMIH